MLGIVGPSGCGKSTLLEIVCGLREPSDGSVLVGEAREPEQRLASCAYMPQRDLLLPWLSAIDNAALAPSIAGVSRERARAGAPATFERLGLAGFESARPEELSGGMRQRVAFLRTLMAGRPLLLLDEPFASLDAITRADAQAWLAGVLATDSHTVMLVTHDVEEALYLSDQVVVMSAAAGARDRDDRRAGTPRAGSGGRGHLARVRASCASARCGCLPGARRERPACARRWPPRWWSPACSPPGSWPRAGTCSPTCSRSSPSWSPPRPTSPSRCGRTARCSPTTPG